jgi:hypothetical protein
MMEDFSHGVIMCGVMAFVEDNGVEVSGRQHASEQDGAEDLRRHHHHIHLLVLMTPLGFTPSIDMDLICIV